jgi:hypothetical protein
VVGLLDFSTLSVSVENLIYLLLCFVTGFSSLCGIHSFLVPLILIQFVQLLPSIFVPTWRFSNWDSY